MECTGETISFTKFNGELYWRILFTNFIGEIAMAKSVRPVMDVQGHQAAAAGGGPGAGLQPEGSQVAELRRV